MNSPKIAAIFHIIYYELFNQIQPDFRKYCLFLSTAGNSLLLYKTKEGNWYDVQQNDSPFKNTIMLALKYTINQKESTENYYEG